MLSHANLTRLARLHREHDFSRDLVQEYLDSLLSVEAFEPLEESKDKDITDSNTAVKTPRPRSKQSKKAKSQTAPPFEKSRLSEKSKPSLARRRHGPQPPGQHKHGVPNGHVVREELQEIIPTSETTNDRKLTLLPAEKTQCGEEATKRMLKWRTKRTTEQSVAVEHKVQELDVGDTGPTQTRNKSRNGRRMKQRSKYKQPTQGQGQGQGQGAMTEQPEDEPRSSRNFEVHAQTDKTEATLLSPRKNEERVIEQNSQPAPTAARTGNRSWHKKPNARKRHGEPGRGGKGRNCSLEAGSVSMRQIASEVGRVQGL